MIVGASVSTSSIDSVMALSNEWDNRHVRSSPSASAAGTKNVCSMVPSGTFTMGGRLLTGDEFVTSKRTSVWTR